MATAALEIFTLPVLATAVLTRNRFTTIAGALPAAGASSLGPVTVSAAIGERVPVSVMGSTRVEAGGPIALGAAIECDALGRGITRTTGVILGRALSAASAAGQTIEMLLIVN